MAITDISADSNVTRVSGLSQANSNGILVKKREEFLTAGYALFIVQFVQHQNIVKTRFVFPNKARNAEILLECFNDNFGGF